MVLPMARPWKHPKTGVLHFQGRVPVDILDRAAGQTVALSVAGPEVAPRISPVMKISLGTRDPTEAKVHHAAVQAQVLERWATQRNGAVALTHHPVLPPAGTGQIRALSRQHAAICGLAATITWIWWAQSAFP